MTHKIKFWLIFILVYILAFFVWWTYSLINLSQEKHTLLLKNEELRAKQVCMQMRSTVIESKGADYPISKIEEYTSQHCKGLELIWNSDGMPDYKVAGYVIEENKIAYRAERLKYLLEGISMFIMIAIGIVWIFIRIGKILNVSKQQNNFLLSVSHELKTPITAIQLSGQTLYKNFEKLNEVNRVKLLHTINANTVRLNDLIDQMLILTRIEGAQYKYHKEDIELKSMVDSVVKTSPNTDLSHFTVINNLPSNSFVVFDRLTLELCISNLIENAIKYSPDGEKIKISGKKKGGYWIVEISDEGIGIEDTDKKRIFEKFYRVGNEDTRTTKGTGLGLYMVKQILIKQNANIKVKDNMPNGSIFVIKLKTK